MPTSPTACPPTRPAGARPGLTLGELLVTLAVTAVIFGAAIPFLTLQARSVTRQAGRLESQLNVRFGVSAIDRDLRAAGVGVVDAQPMLVEADGRALTLNANLVSRTRFYDRATGLPAAAGTGPSAGAYDDAVNLDPDAPDGAVGVLTRAGRVALPATGIAYPDCTYVQGGGASTFSRAETVSFFVRRDSTSTRPDQYVLFRRVNALAPEVLARGLVLAPGEAVFSYFQLNATGQQVPVPADSLPLVHRAAMHGSPADTGRGAMTDAVRYVRVRLVGRAVDRRTGRQSLDTVQASVRLMNAGLMRRATCGEAPLFGGTFTATDPGAPTPQVRLTWTPASDERGGERDVERYLVFRRLATDPPGFGEPLLSVGVDATTAAYQYVDTQVLPATAYVYGLAAQDCNPLNSPIAQAAVTTRP